MSLYIQEAAPRQQSPMPQHITSEDEHQAAVSKSKEEKRVSTECSTALQSHAPPFHPSHARWPKKLEPLQMTNLQSSFIADTMQGLKERAAKRQKVTNNSTCDAKEPVTCQGSDFGGSISSAQFDILDELDAHPHTVQVVATSGGLITHWNEAFTKVTKPSAALLKIPLTIFELVDYKALPSLYSMLALSLHNVGVTEVENFSLEEDGSSKPDTEVADDNEKPRSSSHLSITLPCKMFLNSPNLYDITVVFMNDIASKKRCFLGILTPRTEDDDISCDSCPLFMESSSKLTKEENATGTDHQDAKESSAPQQLPRGKILRVDDDLLCQMLLSSCNVE